MKQLLNLNKINAKNSLGQNFITNEVFLNELEKNIKFYLASTAEIFGTTEIP